MMDVIEKASSIGAEAPGELKIKGQAEFERRKSKWDVAEGDDIVRIDHGDFVLFWLILCVFRT